MKPQKLNVTKTVTEITTGADGEDVVTSREVPVKFTKIAAGPDFAMAIDVDGNLYTWGRNNNGQIGNGTDTSDFIDEKESIRGIKQGNTCSITSNGCILH